MKKIILSMALALMVSAAFGQTYTVETLMEKYKALEGAQYQEVPRDSMLAEMVKDDELIAQGISEKEIAYTKKNLKRMEQVTMKLDETQRKELDEDIKSVKGYELLFVVNENDEPEEGGNILQQMWNQVMNSKSQISVYGKTKKNVVDGVLLRWDIWDQVVLGHLDGKMKMETLSKAFTNSDDLIRIEKEKDVVDMKDVLEEVKSGNALFVIDGEEHPELHSLDEAKVYMKAKDFHSNQESWVVGGAVKEKYPNTDKKVVIEFSDYTKEMQKYVEKGDVLFVINGKECPELRSIEAAKAYMKSNGIECSNQHWVSKDEAKRKYPNTDRKAIIEYY